MRSFVSGLTLGLGAAALLTLAACNSVALKTAGSTPASPPIATPATSAAPSPSQSSGALVTGEPVNVEPYDANAKPALSGKTHQITLVAKEGEQEIAPGVKYAVWTFDGHAPGPVIRVTQGDTVEFTLRNEGKMPHSIDFHAAQTAWDQNYKSINPGETLTFSFKANYPGVFMYHCGTAPALMHIADGMYGAIIVDPAKGLAPAKEFVLVQSEFYAKPSADGKINEGDFNKMLAGQPDFVVFNGMAQQYAQHPLQADPGQRIRFWVVNAGPNEFSAFHVVGAILDKVYPDGNPANVLTGMQTYTIPPGGGMMAELTVPDAGLYPVVSHSFSSAQKGAMAILKVGNPSTSAGVVPAH